jgi:hypothetical protein
VILDLLPTHGVTFFPASGRRFYGSISTISSKLQIIRDAGLYGWGGSGIWIQNPSLGAPSA